MKPLATFNYTKNNIMKMFPIIISMTVGVFLVYFISLVGKSSVDTMDITKYKLLQSYTIVYTNTERPLPEGIIEKVKNSSSVDKVIPLLNDQGVLMYKSVFGIMSFNNLNLYEKDIPVVLDRLVMKLVEGSMPIQDKNEVLIPVKYAKQKKIKTGDKIGSNISSDYRLQGNYTVSGIIDGPMLVSITSSNSSQMSPDKAMTRSFMFSIKNDNDRTIIEELKKSNISNVVITDYSFVKKAMDQVLDVLTVFTLSLDIMTILILCISLGNLNYMNFLNRKYEFGVLSVIGYRRTKLYIKLWKENSLTCLTGYVMGIILATLVCFLVNLTIWQVDGKFVPLWSTSGAVYALTVPLFVSIFGLIPPIREIRKTDPIDVLGGNI